MAEQYFNKSWNRWSVTRRVTSIAQISPAPRVFFLDVLRALAVVLMVQGHTLDVLLANDYRSFEYPSFRLWQFVRGLTAPLFLMTAGAVFIYLLRATAMPLRDNPRADKGVKRALLLFALGYLLRLPFASPVSMFFVPDEAWRGFWVVDVLQLIGAGLLLLLCGAFLSERCKVRAGVIFTFGGFFFFLGAPFCEQFNWNEWLPGALAAYFYSGSGSSFPLFPWAGYVLSGGVLGAYLTQLEQPLAERRLTALYGLSLRLAVVGGVLLMLYFGCGSFKAGGFGSGTFWSLNPDLPLMRLGAVLLLTAFLARLCAGLRAIPPSLLSLGRRSLLIYVAHLVLLYGSP